MSTLPGQHSTRSHIRINDVSFYGPGELEQVAWDSLQGLHLPEGAGGRDEGRVMVRLAVDDSPMDVVYADLGPTDDLAALQRAIDALKRAHAGLSELYAAATPLIGAMSA